MTSSFAAPAIATAEEEDALIQARVANDERPLRRLVRKFHAFSFQAGATSADTIQVDDARKAFLLELANFQMSLRKSALSCQAESRQVLEYQREKERLECEQTMQREQIAALKATLEEAQLTRRRKMEYDRIAEQINALPARTELDQAIKLLETDIAGIQEEREQLKRNVQARREKLEMVQQEIQFMNRVGRENDPDDIPPEVEVTDATDATQTPREGGGTPEPSPTPSRLNPEARSFQPSSSHLSLRESVLRKAYVESTNVSNAPSPTTQEEGEEREDIEMGEVSEHETGKDKSKRKVKEDLEEGEASDESSELSELPE